jgi:biopolymer transport protein ExbD
MKIESFKRRSVELNLSPLIDVIFILVIFIVLVARFIEQNQLDIDVPDTDAGRPATLEALIVNVTQEGFIFVGDVPVEAEGVEALLRSLRGKHDRILLLADGKIALQQAVDVLTSARKAGYDEVSLATEPPKGGKPAKASTGG